MQKIFKWFICSVVCLLIFILSTLSYKKINEKKATEKNIQTFHEFCALNIANNQEFCTKSLTDKSSIIILFMNPECDSCYEKIKQIKEWQLALEKVSILLITTTPKKQANDFYSAHQLSNFSNIRMLIDENFGIFNFFNIKTIPALFIYDKNKKLIFNHKGEIMIETFIHYLIEE